MRRNPLYSRVAGMPGEGPAFFATLFLIIFRLSPVPAKAYASARIQDHHQAGCINFCADLRKIRGATF
jgi:hypothetical protein